MSTRIIVCLTALGALSMSCARRGQDTIHINVHVDDTCDVDGESVQVKKLRNHLRAKREADARLELMKIDVSLPWNGTEEDCERQQKYIRQVLTSIQMGTKVTFSQAKNPYIEFAAALLPWIVVIAVAVVAATQIKKRRKKAEPK